ncbi:allantoicase [Caulobacter sp. KR2-114]|uniref:allantoicase n=1 Tax=Caulobacter sp. KR2-114 TaxID=3400912 RepID=UPI003C128740
MSLFDDLRGRYVDLAQPRLGSAVVYATDDFFADKSRLISPAEPVFIPGKYDDNGKWMDGWESRRKRTPGHDWCVVALGVPGIVAGFEIDTRHFTGNFPPGAMVEVCRSRDELPGDDAGWLALTPRLDLKGDDRAWVAVDHAEPVTHVRLHIYPDGGVARLRVWGRVVADWSTTLPGDVVDLLAMAAGGRGVIANNEHYGRVENLTAPGRGVDMGDGWETRRRREPGHDWAVLELGAAGIVEELEVDTAHFKGNYPDRCSVQAALTADGAPEAIAAAAEAWPELLPETKLRADHVHVFRGLAPLGPVRFIRLNIFPDGGVSRLRVRGRLAAGG